MLIFPDRVSGGQAARMALFVSLTAAVTGAL